MKVEVIVTNKYVVDVDALNSKFSRNVLRYAPFASTREDKSNVKEAITNVVRYDNAAILDHKECCEALFLDGPELSTEDEDEGETDERENMG